MQSAAFPELMPELTPISEALRRRLPRWDPRVWGGQEVLEVTAARRTGTGLRHVGLAWARAHAQRLRAHQSHARTQSARDEATPPIRAQHAPAVEHLKRPARASTDLGGVGGPQAARTRAALPTPQSDAAEDRRRWAPRDHATGELVEARTYQPYGATESDYRPERWKGYREDYGFTGKEEDVEVGLQYFGKRFLSPYLGRWISADPLGVHGPGLADLNLYAYVAGAVLQAVDPLGLTCGETKSCAAAGGVEATTDYDAAPSTTFTVTVRRFAPFKEFGVGFHGDAGSRGVTTDGSGGFSTSPEVSSRITTVVKVEGEAVQQESYSSVSTHPWTSPGVSVPDVSVDAHPTSTIDGHVDLQVAGANPLTWTQGHLSPAPFGPDIDTDMSIDYEQIGQSLRIAGTAWGDDFPNLEVFATDSAGNSFMLGTFQTGGGRDTGPLRLFGAGEREGEDQLLEFDAQVQVDEAGEFMSSPNVSSSSGPVEE